MALLALVSSELTDFHQLLHPAPCQERGGRELWASIFVQSYFATASFKMSSKISNAQAISDLIQSHEDNIINRANRVSKHELSIWTEKEVAGVLG